MKIQPNHEEITEPIDQVQWLQKAPEVGGVKKLAELLNVSESIIHRWKKNKAVPEDRQPEIYRLFRSVIDKRKVLHLPVKIAQPQVQSEVQTEVHSAEPEPASADAGVPFSVLHQHEEIQLAMTEVNRLKRIVGDRPHEYPIHHPTAWILGFAAAEATLSAGGLIEKYGAAASTAVPAGIAGAVFLVMMTSRIGEWLREYWIAEWRHALLARGAIFALCLCSLVGVFIWMQHGEAGVAVVEQKQGLSSLITQGTQGMPSAAAPKKSSSVDLFPLYVAVLGNCIVLSIWISYQVAGPATRLHSARKRLRALELKAEKGARR